MLSTEAPQRQRWWGSHAPHLSPPPHLCGFMSESGFGLFTATHNPPKKKNPGEAAKQQMMEQILMM